MSAGFSFVVKVEALPPLWRGSVVFGVRIRIRIRIRKSPSTVMARKRCVWRSSSVRDILPCVVCFLGRALESVHWGVISSKSEGVGTLSAT